MELPAYLTDVSMEYRLRKVRESATPLAYDSLPDFLEREMYISETNAPLKLEPEQRAVLEEMSRRDADGNFVYSTWVYSAIKKHGKTTICAGIVLWQMWRVPYAEAYVIGNDLKQSDSRMAEAIRYCVEHNPRMKHRARVIRYNVFLDNGSRIEALPVDPAGEAGMNPTVLAWTEAWGASQRKHEMMWTEAALSPTRTGTSFKLVESYAGYDGESRILQNLYENGVKSGTPHPTVPELYTNGGQITYWCTRRIMPWQIGTAADEYYAAEAMRLPADEYRRIHGNEWVGAENAFVDAATWHNCTGDVYRAERQPVIIGMDAGIVDDNFAIVAVSPVKGIMHVVYTRVWEPPDGGKVDFDDVEKEILRLCKLFNVVAITYDPHQLHYMAKRLDDNNIAWMREFPQGVMRFEADKALLDRIRGRGLVHDGDATLSAHVLNANAKLEGERKLRLVKRKQELKIDAAVALSMACHMAAEMYIA